MRAVEGFGAGGPAVHHSKTTADPAGLHEYVKETIMTVLSQTYIVGKAILEAHETFQAGLMGIFQTWRCTEDRKYRQS